MTLFQKRYRIETARRPGWDYASRSWYFVTLCTEGRVCSLGNGVHGKIALTRVGMIAESQMAEIAEHYSNVAVDRFVIMPNHIHAIIVIEGRHQYSPAQTGDGASTVATVRHAKSLGDVVGGYKAGVSRACAAEGLADFAWQERFYDRILGSNVSVNAVRDYIERNPENWMEDPDHPERWETVVRRGKPRLYTAAM